MVEFSEEGCFASKKRDMVKFMENVLEATWTIRIPLNRGDSGDLVDMHILCG